MVPRGAGIVPQITHVTRAARIVTAASGTRPAAAANAAGESPSKPARYCQFRARPVIYDPKPLR